MIYYEKKLFFGLVILGYLFPKSCDRHSKLRKKPKQNNLRSVKEVNQCDLLQKIMSFDIETKGVIGCFKGAVIVIDFASILILISRQQK